MKLRINKLLKNSTILSIPGILSILLSLISIPIHLNIVGVENYGNYIIFHFLLIISSVLNFGIGKSIAVSINNYPKKSKEVGYEGVKYTIIIILIIISILLIIFNLKQFHFFSKLIDYSLINYFTLGVTLSILYSTLEGIFQGNQKFKSLSFYNFIFFSLSLSLPSLILIIYGNLSLKELIFLSIIIKFFSVLLMMLTILKKGLVSRNQNSILLNNLKINSKWLTLNSILIQFYDLFDKYLVKIFLGPIAIATYSIPQQLTGKLSIISKGFSAYLLPNLSKKNHDNFSFNYSLQLFLKTIPILIFLLFPLYEFLLNLWLGEKYEVKILVLTKIFSLCAIFSGTSHLLITKFEASKTLNKNLKLEFILMPFFLVSLYLLTSNRFSLTEISLLILFKEAILLLLRMHLLNKIILNIRTYYFYIIFFIFALYMSMNFENLFLMLLVLLVIGNFLKK
jgi:O-antigen/teichoic acid export membrane protein